jgi:hypothetical protein
LVRLAPKQKPLFARLHPQTVVGQSYLILPEGNLCRLGLEPNQRKEIGMHLSRIIVAVTLLIGFTGCPLINHIHDLIDCQADDKALPAYLDVIRESSSMSLAQFVAALHEKISLGKPAVDCPDYVYCLNDARLLIQASAYHPYDHSSPTQTQFYSSYSTLGAAGLECSVVQATVSRLYGRLGPPTGSSSDGLEGWIIGEGGLTRTFDGGLFFESQSASGGGLNRVEAYALPVLPDVTTVANYLTANGPWWGNDDARSRS